MRPTGPVLIVSASAGTGHVRAAQALEKAFRAAGVETEHVDVLELAPRALRLAYGGGFELLAKRAPRVWGELYSRFDGPGGDRAAWGPFAARLLFREFERLLRSRPWSHCVCTHFLPAQLASARYPALPFSLAITDHVLHRYWVQPGVRTYFTANDGLAHALGVRLPGARVHVTGIPVDPDLTQADDAAARRQHHLAPDRGIALLVGGGLGIGVEDSVAEALDALPEDVQLVAVCGRNDAARERLAARSIPTDRLRVLGHVEGLGGLLAAADVVITKAGGLTTAEALALGRPLLLMGALPGQEEGNMRHLVAAGAALQATEPGALRAALASFFADPALRFRLGVSARGLGRPSAARHIVTALGGGAMVRRVA